MDSAIVPQFDDGFQTFDFHGIPVRGKLDENGNPIILATGICKALGLTDASRTLAGLPDSEKGHTKVMTPGGSQTALYVTEAGLYRLIFRSNRPEAEEFRTRVFTEVLPTLRKTGSYSVQPVQPVLPMTPIEQFKALVAYMEQTQEQLAEIHEKLGENALAIEAVNDRLDDKEFLTVAQFCQRQRINVPDSVRSQWGKNAGNLSRSRQIPIYDAVEGPRSVGRYHQSILLAVCVAKPTVPRDQLELPEGD